MGTIGRKPADAVLTSDDINDGTITPSDLSTGHPTWTTGGNLGIGNTSPTNKLDISDTGTVTARIRSSDGGTAEINLLSSGVYGWDLQADSSFRLVQDVTERMRIDSSGHLIVPNGVTLGTAAGTYNAANTLDDYEEGTWTPTVTTGTITTNDARYTKIGNKVILTAYCPSISDIASTSAFEIGGLPFAPVIVDQTGSVMVRYINLIGIASYCVLFRSVSLIGLYACTENSTYTAIQHNHFTNANIGMRLQITYTTNS